MLSSDNSYWRLPDSLVLHDPFSWRRMMLPSALRVEKDRV